MAKNKKEVMEQISQLQEEIKTLKEGNSAERQELMAKIDTLTGSLINLINDNAELRKQIHEKTFQGRFEKVQNFVNDKYTSVLATYHNIKDNVSSKFDSFITSLQDKKESFDKGREYNKQHKAYINEQKDMWIELLNEQDDLEVQREFTEKQIEKEDKLRQKQSRKVATELISASLKDNNVRLKEEKSNRLDNAYAKIKSIGSESLKAFNKGKNLLKEAVKASPTPETVSKFKKEIENDLKARIIWHEKVSSKLYNQNKDELSKEDVNMLLYEAHLEVKEGRVDVTDLTQSEHRYMDHQAEKKAKQEIRHNVKNEFKAGFKKFTERISEILNAKDMSKSREKGMEM